MSLRLLIVEDDVALAESLSDELCRLGHDVAMAADGHEALSALARERFDAIILDRMLPQVEGMALLKRIRQQDTALAIVMLSALDGSSEKIEGLEAGADDYMGKPVVISELNARLHAVLRGRTRPHAEEAMIEAGDLVLQPARFRAWRHGRPINLPNALEFKILVELVGNAGTVVTRAMLLERVWRYDFDPRSNIVEVYIGRLRRRLTEHGDPDPIRTIKGVGYVLGD